MEKKRRSWIIPGSSKDKFNKENYISFEQTKRDIKELLEDLFVEQYIRVI